MSPLPPAPRQIPIVDARQRSLHDASGDLPALPLLAAPLVTGQTPMDLLGRPLRDLRISVTDRCNFRCGYCMPRSVFSHNHEFLPHGELLNFEEITRAARIFLSLGVRKLRLTGGEPLLRKGLPELITQLSALRTLDGTPPELTLTTNGSLLARQAQALKDAGLQRVTVSLDALSEDLFQRLIDARMTVSEVLAGIESAQKVGLGPIKVNMVVQRGVNDGEIVPMARHFRGTGIELRFIEFMDVGATNQWRREHVLPSDEVRAQLAMTYPLRPAEVLRPGDTAQRWAYADGMGHVGFISSVTQAFCGDCNRMRLSTDGKLYTCLFATQGHDLRTLLRAPEPMADEALAARVAALWQGREDRYSQLRGQLQAQVPAAPSTPHTGAPRRIEMSYIGG